MYFSIYQWCLVCKKVPFLKAQVCRIGEGMRIIQRYEFQHPLFQSMLLNMEENYCRYHEPSEYDKIYTQHSQGKIFSVKYHMCGFLFSFWNTFVVHYWKKYKFNSNQHITKLAICWLVPWWIMQLVHICSIKISIGWRI